MSYALLDVVRISLPLHYQFLFFTLETLPLQLNHSLFVFRISTVFSNIYSIRSTVGLFSDWLVGGARGCRRAILTCTLVFCSVLVKFFFVHTLQFLKYSSSCLKIALFTVLLVECQQFKLVFVDIAIIYDVTWGIVDWELSSDQFGVFDVELVWLLIARCFWSHLLLLLITVWPTSNRLRLIFGWGGGYSRCLMNAILLLIQSAVGWIELTLDAPTIWSHHTSSLGSMGTLLCKSMRYWLFDRRPVRQVCVIQVHVSIKILLVVLHFFFGVRALAGRETTHYFHSVRSWVRTSDTFISWYLACPNGVRCHI